MGDLQTWLQNNSYLAYPLIIAGTFLSGAVAYFVARRVIVALIRRMVKASRTTWDDHLVKARFFSISAHLAPAFVIYFCGKILIDSTFLGDPGVGTVFLKLRLAYMGTVFKKLGLAYMIVVGTLAVDAVVKAAGNIYRTLEVSKSNSIKSFVQTARLLIVALGIVFLISMLAEKDPWALLAGLGAVMAIVLLVFKDTILGFVASLNIVFNDLLNLGDWISMPKYGADGDVVDITLTTVKVQNFDKTITNIPTYALMSESFKNWRGMKVAGGRRIKRAIHIDTNTIKFCTEEMLDRLSQFELLADYITEKRNEVEEHNRKYDLEGSEIVTQRRLTNVGTFRAYIERYLQNHAKIRDDLTCLVRQLPIAENGLPIEVYAFCSDTVWREYERVQADLFDHLIAVVPEFDLRVFQNPTGHDFARWTAPGEIRSEQLRGE